MPISDSAPGRRRKRCYRCSKVTPDRLALAVHARILNEGGQLTGKVAATRQRTLCFSCADDAWDEMIAVLDRTEAPA